MIRLFAATAPAALLMSACSGAMPAPVAPIAPAAAPPAAGVVTVAAMNLMCGGTSFRVSFQKTQAEVINDDGTTISLPLLAPAADAEPGVGTYTDGKMYKRAYEFKGGGYCVAPIPLSAPYLEGSVRGPCRKKWASAAVSRSEAQATRTCVLSYSTWLWALVSRRSRLPRRGWWRSASLQPC